MNILETILATKKNEVAKAKKVLPMEEIRALAQEVKRPKLSMRTALENSPTGIIAEFKRKSPSKGFIKQGANAVEIAGGYAHNGAAGISVLTDGEYFGGSIKDLIAARAVASVPLLRKDFVIDPYQICQARIAGADCILLIAAALDPETTAKLAEFAHTLNLEVLLEVHNREELAHFNDAVDIVGVNNRNLATFATDVAVSEELAAYIPGSAVKISESGISSSDTVRALREKGFRGFLMGENFMKEADPAAALATFISQL